jgi:regulator of protease activity HflC (stomatin/prohibitin superfamily)
MIHDAEQQFRRSLQQNFGDRYGFEIEMLRIENMHFADKNLQKSVSEFAVTFTKLAAQQATIKAQRQVQLAEAERDAATLKTKAETEAQIKIRMMKAEAEAIREKARAEADSLTMRADAEASAIRAKGDAEAEVLQKYASLPNSSLSMILQSQERALKDNTKVIFSNQPQMLFAEYGAIMKQVSELDAGRSSRT